MIRQEYLRGERKAWYIRREKERTEAKGKELLILHSLS